MSICTFEFELWRDPKDQAKLRVGEIPNLEKKFCLKLSLNLLKWMNLGWFWGHSVNDSQESELIQE